MKTTGIGVFALALATSFQSARADFLGPTAPAAWTIANLGTLIGSQTLGSAAFSTSQLVLTGANSTGGCSAINTCEIQTTVGLGGTYNFHWSYSTLDNPANDVFGVIVDGVRHSVSDASGFGTQTGVATYLALSSFGFFVNCTTCVNGAATVTITNFERNISAVPLPAALPLFATGLGALGLLGWRRKRKQASA